MNLPPPPPPAPPRSVLRMPMIERLELLADNVRRMFRTGAQATLTTLALSDATPVDMFDLDAGVVLGSFGGGCIVWIITTLAAPPKS